MIYKLEIWQLKKVHILNLRAIHAKWPVWASQYKFVTHMRHPKYSWASGFDVLNAGGQVDDDYVIGIKGTALG